MVFYYSSVLKEVELGWEMLRVGKSYVRGGGREDFILWGLKDQIPSSKIVINLPGTEKKFHCEVEPLRFLMVARSFGSKT